MIKPWHVAFGTPVIAFVCWNLILIFLPTLGILQPTVMCLAIGMGTPLLIIQTTLNKDKW